MTRDRDGERANAESLDRLFTVLSNRARRRVLWALARDDFRTGAGVEVAAFVPDDDPGGFRRDLRDHHFPYLDEAGFIDWDARTGTVTRGPRFAEIEPLIAALAANADELPWELP